MKEKVSGHDNTICHGEDAWYPALAMPISRDRTSTVVDAAGRLVVPAPFRAALGFRPRQEVVLTLDGSSIRMMTVEASLEAAVARVQSLARKYGGGGGGEVDAFIAERRAEARKE